MFQNHLPLFIQDLFDYFWAKNDKQCDLWYDKGQNMFLKFSLQFLGTHLLLRKRWLQEHELYHFLQYESSTFNFLMQLTIIRYHQRDPNAYECTKY